MGGRRCLTQLTAAAGAAVAPCRPVSAWLAPRRCPGRFQSWPLRPTSRRSARGRPASPGTPSYRRRRAAHRHLCGAGRGRAQGLAARRRAHQFRRRPDQAVLAQDHEGRAGQEARVRGRGLGRQAERRGAGRAALHRRQQGDADDRLDLVGRGGRAQQARAARTGALPRRHFRLQRHHRQGLRALRLPPELLGQTAAAAIAPVLIKAFGKGKKGPT